MRSGLLSCAFLIVMALPAISESKCDPVQLAKSVDTYANAPFSARTWRMLNGLGDPGIEPQSNSNNEYELSEKWRKRVGQIAPDMQALKNAGFACRIGYPLEILEKRIAQFGADSDYVTQWLKGQASVISACSDIDFVPIPSESPQDFKAEEFKLFTADRAYQAASVAFYQDPSVAIELFRAIAKTDSPHRAVARYNVANLLANAKNIAGARDEAEAILADLDFKSVHRITQELLGYLANIEDTASAWTDLIDGSVATISRPATEITASEVLREAYATALYDLDYAGIGRKRSDWWITGKLPEGATLSKAVLDASRKHPVAVWMMAGQTLQAQYDAAPWSLNQDKWNNWTASYLARAMALTPAQGITGLSRDVLEALSPGTGTSDTSKLWQKVKAAELAAVTSCGTAPETAAFGVLLQHATRVSATAGKWDEALTGLHSVSLKSTEAYYRHSVKKLGEHLLASGNLEQGRRYRDTILTKGFFAALPVENREWLQSEFAAIMEWLAEDQDRWVEALQFSNRKLSNPVFNLLPAKDLRQLSSLPVFEPDQQALLQRAAWTRNFSMNITQKRERFADVLKQNPAIERAYDQVAADYAGIKPENRRLLTILRNPRFGILVNSPDNTDPIETKRQDFTSLDQFDHNDKNWWCPLEPDRNLAAIRAAYDRSSGINAVQYMRKDDAEAVIDSKVLSAAANQRESVLLQHPIVKLIDWNEVDLLAAAPSAPKLLTERAMAWAKVSRGSDGAPEALSLAVRLTRYGCNWHGGHGAYSKAAQEMLKTKFRDSPWTAQAPYWFNCVAQRTGVCEKMAWPKQKRW